MSLFDKIVSGILTVFVLVFIFMILKIYIDCDKKGGTLINYQCAKIERLK